MAFARTVVVVVAMCGWAVGCTRSAQSQHACSTTSAPAAPEILMKITAMSSEMLPNDARDITTPTELRSLGTSHVWCDQEVLVRNGSASIEFQYECYSKRRNVSVQLLEVQIRDTLVQYEIEVYTDGELSFLGPRESGRRAEKVGHIWSRELPEQDGVLLAIFVEFIQ